MTDKDKAVQEAECVAAADEYFKARAWLMDTNDNRRIFEAGFDRAYALLSKLRAEGVQAGNERAAFEAAYAKRLRDKGTPPTFAAFMTASDGSYVLPIVDTAWDMWKDARAALASAPVAGEAQPGDYVQSVPDHCDRIVWCGRYYALPPGAPQASEAVRILFPAHLRKMWSGGEVQAWLDEHQGVTAPKPSAKGSLERYRKWQAERDEAFAAGVKAAADLVKKMVDDYDTDHGSTDPETGSREYPGEGATWVCEMQELEESIRALSAQPGAQKEQSDV